MEIRLVQAKILSGVQNLRHGFGPSFDEKTATVKQVHKSDIVWVAEFEKGKQNADAIGTVEIKLAVGIYSADCAPILLASLDRNRKAIAVMAVHAGWRGAALGIAANSVEALWNKSSGVSLVAAIGPTIGFDAFEVGAEVIAAFPECEQRGLARFFRMEGDKRKYQFNLPGENARQIASAAARLKIPCEIEVLSECTFSNPDRYPSFRRDREKAGRILSFIERTC
jgi:YfiH family protein